MKILIATHKDAVYPDDPGYVPFQNGRLVSDVDLNILNDGVGINISTKMPYYSECCTLFWLLNNIDDNMIGMMHYRRYLSPRNRSVCLDGQLIAASDDFDELENADLLACLEYDTSPLSVRQQYEKYHIGEDLIVLRRVLAKMHPGYLRSFDSVMDGSIMTVYNIFVAHRSVIKHYTDWLFPIMFVLENLIPYESYGNYQKRVFAFLSERLFTVWIKGNEEHLRIARRSAVYLSF